MSAYVIRVVLFAIVTGTTAEAEKTSNVEVVELAATTAPPLSSCIYLPRRLTSSQNTTDDVDSASIASNCPACFARWKVEGGNDDLRVGGLIEFVSCFHL